MHSLILAAIILCNGHTITDQSKAQDGTIVFAMPDGSKLRCKDYNQDPKYGDATVTMEDHNKYRCEPEIDATIQSDQPDSSDQTPDESNNDPVRQKI